MNLRGLRPEPATKKILFGALSPFEAKAVA